MPATSKYMASSTKYYSTKIFFFVSIANLPLSCQYIAMTNLGRIISIAEGKHCLDSVQMEQLEQAFRYWAETPVRPNLALSRKRILLIFLLIRYTGAKLSEVLALDMEKSLDVQQQLIAVGTRKVQIAQHVAQTLRDVLQAASGSLRHFAIDPAFVRRKFYERAEDCGFSKNRASPEMIRKARAIELMQGNLPVPVVQRLLGHSTPNLTTACVTFSEEDMRQVTRWYMENESGRKTSARNSFFGKVHSLRKGEVQTLVYITTLDGGLLTTIVTNTSAEHLGLKPGSLLSAEVKAPWLVLERQDSEGRNSLENRWEGIIARITPGKVNTECAVCIAGGAELCAVVSSPGFEKLRLKEGDPVCVLFSCYAVILRAN